LLYQLCKTGEKIRATKRDRSNLDVVKKVFSYYSDDFDKLFNRIEWVDADLLNIAELELAFDGITKVYHCAAWVNFNPKYRHKMIENNVVSTANIVNLCLNHQVKKLCHISSVAAIGKTANSNIITEETTWTDGPENSNYAISKYNSELEIWRGIEEGLNAVIVNPSIILGPGRWKKGSSRIFYQIEKGMPFYPTGSNGFVDVRDVVKVMMQLMESTVNSERFIICAENIPFRKTFDFIARALDKKKAHIKLGTVLGALGWRIAKIISLFTGKGPVITKESVLAGNNISVYENNKIKKALNFEFKSIEQSCKDFSELFLKEHK